MGGESILNSEIGILLRPDYVPEGKYVVQAQEMSLNMTKDNDHYYIMADFMVQEGSFRGRLIKQIWSFRLGQEMRTVARINNFISKVTSETIEATNGTIQQVFDKIHYWLMNENFEAWLVKDADGRSATLYAEARVF